MAGGAAAPATAADIGAAILQGGLDIGRLLGTLAGCAVAHQQGAATGHLAGDDPDQQVSQFAWAQQKEAAPGEIEGGVDQRQ